MKVNQSVCAVLLGVCLLLEPTSSTILTTTLFTGFVGGFLVGKVTLGTFLTIMNSLNRGQTVANKPTSATAAAASGSSASTQTQTVVTRGGSEEDAYHFQDISPSLENQVRDRFLRELGKMDPLSCLPKVFCEISADPTTANGLFGESGIFGSQVGLALKPRQPQTKKPKLKKQKKHVKKSKDEVEDDVQDQDDDEDASESEESDEEDDGEDEVQDEESLKLQRYELKEKQALESKALDELIDEFDDPISYYFILKDKKKNIHPELQAMMSEADLSRMDKNRRTPAKKPKNRPSMLIRRIGQAAKSSVESSSRTIVPKISTQKTTEPSTDDAFASDPFFDEFSKSLNEPKPKNSIKFGQIELLRRSKRDIFDDDEHDATMAKYRMAAKVADKFKDPAKCQKVFSTCPFSSEEVMNMITKMNEEDSSPSSSFSYSVKKKNKKNKTKGQDDGLKNLKNTLLAIEKLNDVTVHAQFSGEPVDYEKIIREAADSTASQTSDKIIEDFEQFEDYGEASEEPQSLGKSPKKKSKKPASSGGNKNKKKVVTRHRRDGELPIEAQEEVILQSQRSRTSRLSLVSPQGPQKTSRLAYSSSEDDGDTEEDTLPFSSSIESKLQTRLQLRPPQRQRPQKPTYTSSQETTKSKFPPNKSEEEDDEVNSPEYEQTRVKVPSFSQSFQETVQTPTKIRNKPRPVHPIVKVKDQYAKAPTSSTTALPFRSKLEGSSSSNSRYSKPKPLRPQGASSHQKFSGELEDDEEDAVISEKHAESALSSTVPKYKPRRPSSSSHNSYISS